MGDSTAEIEWPVCLSCVVMLKPIGFFGSIFSGPKMKVLSISGGQLQYSSHPNLLEDDLKDKTTSREWSLKDLKTLDGFHFDPRDPSCTDHASMNGGLLGAKIEDHSDVELTLSSDMAESPLRIEFLNKEVCSAFKGLVDKNSECCKVKFNAQVGDAAKAQNDGK